MRAKIPTSYFFDVGRLLRAFGLDFEGSGIFGTGGGGFGFALGGVGFGFELARKSTQCRQWHMSLGLPKKHTLMR